MALIFPQFAGKLIDSHCHLTDPSFGLDLEQVVARSKNAGVEAIIDLGIDFETSKQAIRNAQRFAGTVFAGIGIDPECLIPGSSLFNPALLESSDVEFAGWLSAQITALRELALAHPDEIAMIGETGMDGFHLAQKMKSGELAQETIKLCLKRQTDLFVEHIKLANELNLPLSIHSRGLEQETLDVLVAQQGRGIMHCFTGSREVLKNILESGNGVGISAIYTYNSGKELLNNLQAELTEREIDLADINKLNELGIYFETDAPYLALRVAESPRNEPVTVARIVEYISTKV